jgi:hypothetical protein
MLDNGKEPFDTENEDEDMMETNLLPTLNLQTPIQVTYNHSFPFYAFTPYAVPFGTPVTPQSTPKIVPKGRSNLSRTATYPLIPTTTSLQDQDTPKAGFRFNTHHLFLKTLSWIHNDHNGIFWKPSLEKKAWRLELFQCL